MADGKILRLGTVDLNRVFGTINKFAEIQRKVDAFREELKLEFERIKQALRQAKPPERETLQNEFEASRMTLASDVSQYSTKLRDEVVEQIKQVITEKALERSLDVVLDSGNVSMVGLPVVLYAQAQLDMTEEVITAMNDRYPTA